jgi:hypothetical protein
VVSSPEEAVSARESREKPSIEAGWRARNWSWVRNWSCYERGRALVGVTDVLVLLSWVMVLIECSGWRVPASTSPHRPGRSALTSLRSSPCPDPTPASAHPGRVTA